MHIREDLPRINEGKFGQNRRLFLTWQPAEIRRLPASTDNPGCRPQISTIFLSEPLFGSTHNKHVHCKLDFTQ